MTHFYKKRSAFAAIFMLGSGLTGNLAHAANVMDTVQQSVQNAQAELNDAFQNFYQSYKSSPDHTPAQASKLSDQILAPAQASVQKAIHQETIRTFEKSTAAAQNLGAADSAGRLPASGESPEPARKTPAFQIDSAPEEPLDATGIAPMIEFPGTPSRSR
jgi:hypothetical protein